ncbi:MAG: hypothetical protein JNM90_16830 [Burkholderiales bacterium]|nr:hypothetical protein [Burkholderiales bacterium]
MNLDARGVPGVSVVTTGFTDAVATQSQALGFEPAIVYVPHPIQNRTAAELDRIADDAVEAALALLTAPA